MSAEVENQHAAGTSTEQAEQELSDDWFWRPVKRHQTEFVTNKESASAWRQLGRTLQLADRLASQAGSDHAPKAHMNSHRSTWKK
jgi:hypothetical protein